MSLTPLNAQTSLCSLTHNLLTLEIHWNTRTLNCQGQILAVWTLAAKLPNSDLNFAFGVDFVVLFFPREKARKAHQKFPAKFTRDFVRKNSPRISAEAFSW